MIVGNAVAGQEPIHHQRTVLFGQRVASTLEQFAARPVEAQKDHALRISALCLRKPFQLVLRNNLRFFDVDMLARVETRNSILGVRGMVRRDIHEPDRLVLNEPARVFGRVSSAEERAKRPCLGLCDIVSRTQEPAVFLAQIVGDIGKREIPAADDPHPTIWMVGILAGRINPFRTIETDLAGHVVLAAYLDQGTARTVKSIVTQDFLDLEEDRLIEIAVHGFKLPWQRLFA